MMVRVVTSALASVGGRWASGLRDVTSDLSCLDTEGRWVVCVPYSGEAVCARFDRWSDSVDPSELGRWGGPTPGQWESSLDERAYVRAVEATRSAIEAGSVYQANVCRVLTASLPDPRTADVAALHRLLSIGNPAPFGGFLRLPRQGVHVASASPELFLGIARAGDRRVVTSGPIKGTGRTAADLSDKDVAENVMIVDLMRNDLSRICATGSVTVPGLLRLEHHPGLVHLVSDVEGELVPGATWPGIIDATFPPGSVTGAPKLSALSLIDTLEPEARSYYCGAFGWVDADTREAELAVAIRTFWLDGSAVKFGTGAGITWGSDPRGEWRETELKAARLIDVASGTWPPAADSAWQA
jgi:para-aminobenzoate synthetase component 1